MSFWTSAHIHLDLFIWQTLIQSDLQRIQGLLFISSHVSANRTRDLAVSCTCSSGWVMCLERIWVIELNVNRKESAEASHRHREVLTETVEVYDRRREFRGRVRIVFLQQRYDSFQRSALNYLFSLTHFHLYWAEFIILCNKIKY